MHASLLAATLAAVLASATPRPAAAAAWVAGVVEVVRDGDTIVLAAWRCGSRACTRRSCASPAGARRGTGWLSAC